MVFEHGFFHADPHPGNFFIEPDGRIGLIDFGMVGTVDSGTKTALSGLLVAVVTRDIDPLVDACIALGVTTAPPDRVLLAKTLAMGEGIAARLDPTFEMTVALAPYLTRLLTLQDEARAS